MSLLYYDRDGNEIIIDEADAEECPICHNMRSRSKTYCEHCGYAWDRYPETIDEANAIRDAIAPFLM